MVDHFCFGWWSVIVVEQLVLVGFQTQRCALHPLVRSWKFIGTVLLIMSVLLMQSMKTVLRMVMIHEQY